MKKSIFHLVCLLPVALIFSCKTPTPDAVPTTGTLTFFTRSDLGIGNLTISVNSQPLAILSVYNPSGVTCGSGSVNINEPAGTYTWTARGSIGATIITGTVAVTNGNCQTVEIINSGGSTGSTGSTGTTGSTGSTGSIGVTGSTGSTASNSKYAYVSNNNGVLSVVNLNTNTLVTTLNLFGNLRGEVVSPDGKKVYIGDDNNDNVLVLNTADNTIITRVPLVFPNGMAISTDGSKLYVGNNGSSISVVNTSTYAVINTIVVGNATYPFGMVLSPDGSRLYSANFNGTVSVVNTNTYQVISTLNAGTKPQGIAITPDGLKLFVANNGNCPQVAGGNANGTVSVFSTQNFSILATIDFGFCSEPYGMAVSSDGTKAVVAKTGGSGISIINTSDYTVKNIALSDNAGVVYPEGVDISPDGTTAYVALYGASGYLYAVNLATGLVTAKITLGGTPIGFGKFIVK